MDTPSRRLFYREHLLNCSAMCMDDGRHQARVAIAAVSGERTRAQVFLDLGLFATAAEAVAHAEQSGKEWVDNNGEIVRR